MFMKRKRLNNFICDPEDPWGPVFDSTLTDDDVQFTSYMFIDYQDAVKTDNHDALETIEKLKELFTQFKEDTN